MTALWRILAAILLSALPATALEVIPRSVGTGENDAFLHIQFQDGAIYVFNVHFDSTTVSTKQMVDAVAAELPLTYVAENGGASLRGLTYDGHTYQDWWTGFWSLWFSTTGQAPWTYSEFGWMGLTTGDGRQWHGLVADPGFTFDASPAPITLVNRSGDFNADGNVDGLDFLRWQAGFPNTTGLATQWRGDGNGDGNVDGLDFLVWQARFNTGSTAAPEPSAAAMLALGAAGLWRRRRRQSMRLPSGPGDGREAANIE